MAPTTSYNGWPLGTAQQIGVNAKWEPIPGHTFPGGIKAGDVEDVFTYVVRQLHSRVESIEDGPHDDWGYVAKYSANSKTLPSCHWSATAVDWNATLHPNGKRGTFTKAQAAEIKRILAEVDNVVDWRAHVEEGGVATGTADEMHFEISQVRGSAAAVARVAARIRAGQVGAAPVVVPVEDDMCYLLTPEGLMLFAPWKCVKIETIKGIDVGSADQPDRLPINQWDLRQDLKTWDRIKRACGGVSL